MMAIYYGKTLNLCIWFSGNELERALKSIKREDVVQKCMYNVEVIQDQVEMAAAKVAMDQSGN